MPPAGRYPFCPPKPRGPFALFTHAPADGEERSPRSFVTASVELETIVFPAYAATLGLLAVYGVHRVAMLARFRWEDAGVLLDVPHDAPRVTVQLPVFNERTVAARLIQAAGELDWPRERLEIQVLDDSNDETRSIVEAEVALLVERGLHARVIRRTDRKGFKAGALDHGLLQARGEFVCIFDADFVPAPDFLRRLMPSFADPKVGMVQARWGHANREDNLLTRAESTLLDGHFVIEHKVRHDSGLFFNFNGTAGVWRRAAIDSAGGWEHDTLTEDLDLSYRAQLTGWKFVYAPTVVAPAEVPPDIAAFKSQQHRWAKGSVQVFKKLGWRIITSKEPLAVKLEALAHLTGNVGYPCVLLLALLMPLAIRNMPDYPAWMHVGMFFVCTLSVVMFYEQSQRAIGRPLARRVSDIVAAIVLGIGMCVSQTRAVIEGLLPGTGVFVRTPKKGDGRSKTYRAIWKGLPGVELLLAAWFAWAILGAVELELWGTLPFLVLFFASFAWVGGMSLKSFVRG
ncbi:MAG: glycosyltransferase [Planctomycetes bacterium]|nr:glycosyltransferase [Planctomycetota bacterium]